MRWSIRNQILLPFVVIQGVAITVLSVLLASQAIQTTRLQAESRLGAVVQALSNTRFPLHETILAQMKGLSDADFVTADDRGSLIAATLDPAIATEILSRTDMPEANSFTGPISEFVPVTVGQRRFLVGHANIRKSSNAAELLVLVPEQQWNAVSRATMWPPLLTGAGTLLVMISISILISGRFAARIRRLQGHVQRIAAGHFAESIPESGADELGDLTISIRSMAADLQQLTQQIRSNERATIVTQVAGGLAHQLRNSITGARMAVQLHDRRCSDTDKQSLQVALRQLSVTESQIRGLLTLTSDLQHPARSGQLHDIIENVRLLISPECQHLQIALQVRNNAVNARIRDVDQLEAGLLNVVRNAMEATGPHGCVQIRSEQQGDVVWIDVVDDGPGPTTEFAEQMFDAFVTSKREGVGLGLTLAARTAEDHGGSLTYTRTGDLTRFRFELQADMIS